MLLDPENLRESDAVLNIMFGKQETIRHEEGVFEINHFSFDCMISKHGGNLHDEDPWDSCPGFDNWENSPYGVCDNISQFFETKLGELVRNSTERTFCVSFTHLSKSTQPSEGGWRWHKWGAYIGNEEPQCEYLYDEPVIDTVYVYNIFERKL